MIPKMFRVLCLVFGLSLFGTPFINAQEKESRLINTVPKHLPLKIEIINGDSENLLRDIRVKIINVSDKPIYYLWFYISTTESFLSPSGKQYSFPLDYGRQDFVRFSEKATPDDIPIKPGDFYVFSINDKLVRNFGEMIRNSLRAEPDTYLLEFQFLSFGNGTGFWGGKGSSFPSKTREPSLLNEFVSGTSDFFFGAVGRTHV